MKDNKPSEPIDLKKLETSPSELWTEREIRAWDNSQGVHLFEYLPPLGKRQMRGGEMVRTDKAGTGL